MDKEKVKAVLNWSVHANLKQLRGFLSLTRYYRRFIKGCANITAPLTNLLKNDNFSWNDPTATTSQNYYYGSSSSQSSGFFPTIYS